LPASRWTDVAAEDAMTDVVWAYLVWRYWRGILWTLAWMFAFWMPALLPVPVLGWAAPPLLLWAAVASRRRWTSAGGVRRPAGLVVTVTAIPPESGAVLVRHDGSSSRWPAA
jgi:hypothetical protein